jgi:hypothetical protein
MFAEALGKEKSPLSSIRTTRGMVPHPSDNMALGVMAHIDSGA